MFKNIRSHATVYGTLIIIMFHPRRAVAKHQQNNFYQRHDITIGGTLGKFESI